MDRKHIEDALADAARQADAALGDEMGVMTIAFPLKVEDVTVDNLVMVTRVVGDEYKEWILENIVKALHNGTTHNIDEVKKH